MVNAVASRQTSCSGSEGERVVRAASSASLVSGLAAGPSSEAPGDSSQAGSFGACGRALARREAFEEDRETGGARGLGRRGGPVTGLGVVEEVREADDAVVDGVAEERKRCPRSGSPSYVAKLPYACS